MICEFLDNLSESFWKISIMGRASELVVYDPDLISCLAESKHSVYEILMTFISSIEPTGSYDDSIGIFRLCKFFSEIFRHSIRIYGIWLLRREVSSDFRPVENIVSGYGDEIYASFICNFREIKNTECIDIEIRLFPSIFSFLHIRIGRTIQDNIWS